MLMHSRIRHWVSGIAAASVLCALLAGCTPAPADPLPTAPSPIVTPEPDAPAEVPDAPVEAPDAEPTPVPEPSTDPAPTEPVADPTPSVPLPDDPEEIPYDEQYLIPTGLDIAISMAVRRMVQDTAPEGYSFAVEGHHVLAVSTPDASTLHVYLTALGRTYLEEGEAVTEQYTIETPLKLAFTVTPDPYDPYGNDCYTLKTMWIAEDPQGAPHEWPKALWEKSASADYAAVLQTSCAAQLDRILNNDSVFSDARAYWAQFPAENPEDAVRSWLDYRASESDRMQLTILGIGKNEKKTNALHEEFKAGTSDDTAWSLDEQIAYTVVVEVDYFVEYHDDAGSHTSGLTQVFYTLRKNPDANQWHIVANEGNLLSEYDRNQE